MNTFVRTQIQNMLLMTKTFEDACELAAKQDDGQVSKEEAKNLKKIHKAVAQFTKELESIK